ncbi:MAG: ABC transporter substrate-binding protein [Actinomycetota bacterium]
MKNGSRFIRLWALLAALMLVAAACGGDDGGGGGGSDNDAAKEDIPTGGTLTMAGTSDVDYMDPGQSYYVLGSALFRGVTRTLVNYPATPDVEKQGDIVPDLATDTGQSNEDATEWTFTIQDGVKWGKALGGEDVPGVTGEEITSADIKYAIERLFIDSVGAQYNYYYNIIEGATEFDDGKAKDISGIETPSDKEIVFRLTEPAGDWPFRLAMPATAPVPKSWASKYDKKQDSDYDNHMVSSGPYYVSEWKTEESISLERNEFWDSATDDIRGAYADSVKIRLGFDPNVAVKKIQDGDFTIAWDAQPTEALLEQTVTDPELSELTARGPSECTRYLYMNTTEKPFDDIKVRQAVNYAIDRENLKRLQGGPVTGPIATSIIPEGISGYIAPDEFNPFETPNMAGDIDKAKQLLAEAGYENGYDDEIFVVGSSTPPHDKYFESVRKDLEDLGFTNITSKLPEFPNQYSQFYGIPSKNVDIGVSAGWCQDYPDGFTFFDPLFHGDNILESGNSNYAEINDPELNQAIDEAAAEADPEARNEAWQEVNKMATDTAVWVPWSWDEDVIPFSPDAVNAYHHTFTTLIDWVNVGVRSSE